MKNKSFLLSLIRYISFFVIGMAVLIIGLWIIAVSEDTITAAIKNSVSTERFRIEMDRLKKGLFYSLSIDMVELKGRNGTLFYIEEVSGKINPLYLFLLRHKSSFRGKINRGIISGAFSIGRNKRSISIEIDNVDIKDIPYLERIALKGRGVLSARFVIENYCGNIKFALSDAQLETFVFSGINIPMEMFNKAQGVASIKGNIIEINSFSLEGPGIYGRVKGRVKDNVADLSLEIMPEPSAQERFLMLAFIDKYKVSPGYYVIPIKHSF